jgi:hypothetical protein
MRRREVIRVHPFPAGGFIGRQGIPGGVTALVRLGRVDRYYRSGAEKSHRNHLGSHCEHAFNLPYSVVSKVLEADEESSRPALFVQSGNLRRKKAENRL